MSHDILKRIAVMLPGIGRLLTERDRLRSELYELGHPPGHYYSPIPSRLEVEERFATLQDRDIVIPGVDLNIAEQERWLQRVADYYSEQAFLRTKTDGHRYYFENRMFLESDALFLFGLMRAIQPCRIVEIGSGFSSAVMLDTAQRHFDVSPQFTFIDPNPERLQKLLLNGDGSSADVIARRVQEVATKPWESLEDGDILFIDSSHVSKCGSDVNFLFSEVMPSLADGVYVHVHDISYPFEYPRSWFTERRWAWNEAYLLRAFLQFNTCFKIVAWVPFINRTMSKFVADKMPLCQNDPGGSFWMQKLSASEKSVVSSQ
jgi:predicted O-methyltransferase YrrM